MDLLKFLFSPHPHVLGHDGGHLGAVRDRPEGEKGAGEEALGDGGGAQGREQNIPFNKC